MNGKKLYLFLFLFSFIFLAGAQNFCYFIPDTVSPYVVFLKVKGEDQWGMTSTSEWHWRKERQFIEDMEEQVFKIAFKEVNWNQISALTQVGVFVCFDKTLRIQYIHFSILKRTFSYEELLPLEKYFMAYARLIKNIDLGTYLYTDNPTKFENGIFRFNLLRKNTK